MAVAQRTGAQRGTLVSGHMDQNLRNLRYPPPLFFFLFLKPHLYDDMMLKRPTVEVEQSHNGDDPDGIVLGVLLVRLLQIGSKLELRSRVRKKCGDVDVKECTAAPVIK